jgi:alkaline phosphatase D
MLRTTLFTTQLLALATRASAVEWPGRRSSGFTASFEHGVASGDPYSDSIVLWSRATPQLPLAQLPPPTINATWRVWREGSDAIEQQGVLATDVARDWTLKLIVSDLAHSTVYHFAFSVGPAHSPTGRFRLPPPAGAHLDELRYGVFSCSSWCVAQTDSHQ